MIYILTGPVHSGKTSLLKRVFHELKKKEVKIDGFLSEVVFEKQEVLGYNLFALKEEKAVPFIRRRGEENWQKIGPYFFLPEGLAQAQEIIFRGKDADFFIVDEIGPLELAGKGLWPALEKVIFQSSIKYLLVVRRQILEGFLVMLRKRKVKVFDIEHEDVLKQILEDIKNHS